MAYEEQFIENEEWVRCESIAGLQEWAVSEERGWDGAEDFLRDMRIDFDEIKGKWFCIVGGRCFLRD